MDAELIKNQDAHAPTENPHEDLQNESNQQDQAIGSRTITWTLECSGAKFDPKAYERLKAEIIWAEMRENNRMTFKSTDMCEIDSFSKKLKAIFSENEEANTVREFSFTISSHESLS